MTIAINSSFTATVPAVGTNSPVINLGQSPAVIGTATALANAGAVVISLRGAPAGAVTYTASGLLRDLAASSAATNVTENPVAEPSAAQAVTQGKSVASAGATGDALYDGTGSVPPVNQAAATVSNAQGQSGDVAAAAVAAATVAVATKA